MDAEPELPLGALIRDFVNRVSHRGGRTLAVMNDASVTLHQILILNQIFEAGAVTPSDLAPKLSMSLPSLSQMIDRLHQLDLVARAEMTGDRRKKRLTLTRKGRALLMRMQAARAADYEAGAAALSPASRGQLAAALERALRELLRAEDARQSA